MFTEASLNKENKTNLVNITLDLQSKLEATSNEPLTGASYTKRKFELGKKLSEAVVKKTQIEEDYKLELAKLEANKEISLKEIDADVSEDAKQLTVELKDIEGFLASGLEIKEAEYADKYEKIEDDFTDRQAKINFQLESAKETLDAFKATVITDKAAIIKTQSREIDDLRYAHEVAMKKEDMSFAEAVAEKFDLELIDTAIIPNLENELESSKKDNKTDIAIAVSSAVKKANDSAEKELTTTKHDYELRVAKLEADASGKTAIIADLKSRNESLQTQVDKASEQVVKALEASRSDVSVTNEVKK